MNLIKKANIVETSTSKSEKTLLIIDEDPAVLDAFRKILAKENYRIIPCPKMDNAMYFVAENDIQMILLDIRHPGLRESILLKEIKNHSPMLPVLLMTAFTNNFSENDALAFGASDYITKPFEIDELLAKIKKLALPNVIQLVRSG